MNDKAVVTTPNATWLPEFPVASPGEICTRVDGRWGPQEYSLWPQLYHKRVLHHACIPVQGALIDGLKFQADDLYDHVAWNEWQVCKECGVPDLGYIDKGSITLLKGVAAHIGVTYHMSTLAQREDRQKFGKHLIATVDQALDQLSILPMIRAHAIALAAHVKRLLLELCGLIVLYEIVQPRALDPAFVAKKALPIRGAFTNDAGTTQVLFRLGIPVWFIQTLTRSLRVVEVHTYSTPISSRMSDELSQPRLHSDGGDLAGVVQHPGDWPFAMQREVLKTLLDIKISPLPNQQPIAADGASDARPAKKVKTSPDVHLDRGRTEQSGSSSRRTRRGKRAAPELPPPHPSLRYQSPHTSVVPGAWEVVLVAAGTLPSPPSPATYYWPPPFLFEGGGGKSNRYYHNYIRIRQFCRQRLLDRTVGAEPLRISEWRDALWGDYRTQPADVPSEDSSTRGKERKQIQQNVRRLFGNTAGLATYTAALTPQWGQVTVSENTAKDPALHAQVLWEAHEINWRCEVRALDAELTRSRDWDVLTRWEREARVCRLWSGIGSGLRVIPRWESGETTRARWDSPDESGWREARSTLSELVGVMARWPGLPEELKGIADEIVEYPADKFRVVQRAALQFYVRTFTNVFKRLPIPPAVLPTKWV
ncbi:uncharacterized protein B0H18DRAFT_874961 [Fomitopsis serialis]|uniref:uncharacterized protein n=1 Tax=Fomitopsis serialis TaxID=139415 RepID=UPI002007EED8|nr:uncharacterized protein B0H18DRAFT_874961 [Neoantrodia serialis]KAH9928326.1 hypothetical protein B0H18DRAFT_874961 [Neoantrodia serialis]